MSAGLRIGLVSPYDLSAPGGVQAQVLGLAGKLAGMGEGPVVIGPGLPQGRPGVDLGRSWRVPGNGSLAPISLDPRARALIREAAADLDLLHVHEPLMPVAALAANRAGPPVVATFHADPPRWVRRLYRAGERGMRRALGRTRAVTAVSATAAAAIPDRIEVTIIPNGVEISRPGVVSRSPHRVVFLGRDEPRKGLDVLLEAWPAVTRTVPAAELTVMGTVRATPGVEWLGQVDDERKFEVLAGSAICVAPNLGGESFGVVLVEAMSVGTPVVASDLRAFRDTAGDAARFFPVGDPGALAGTLIDLLVDRSSQDELRSRGLQRARRYDWDRVATAYREVYRSILP